MYQNESILVSFGGWLKVWTRSFRPALQKAIYLLRRSDNGEFSSNQFTVMAIPFHVILSHMYGADGIVMIPKAPKTLAAACSLDFDVQPSEVVRIQRLYFVLNFITISQN